MAFFFSKFPTVSYDFEKNGRPIIVQNLLSRFKVKNYLKAKTALYYTHNIEDGQTAAFIADAYYEDETLDWMIYIINDIVDINYDWPMEYQVFAKYLKGKYGSVETAMNTNHHYEQIIQSQSVLFDGTIIPEKVIQVDLTTYQSLIATERRAVDCYTYETRLNDTKREIKVLHKNYVPQIINEIESIFA
jgi:hypothetical protein